MTRADENSAGNRRNVGRPAKPDDEVKRHSLNMKATKKLRDKIEAAAERNGRSIAQEVELRLERSFEDEERGGGWQTDSFMRLLGSAISRAEDKFGGKWTEDLAAYAAVRRVVELVIAAKEPKIETLLEPETIDTLRRVSVAIDQAVRDGSAEAQVVADLKSSVDAIIDPLVDRTVAGRLAGDELASLLIE